ncbi:MAG: AMP-binding protein, partial [Acetobacteraceae bacterium]|nr:AMP-binding protein [Acetobacteraceae bacterium]
MPGLTSTWSRRISTTAQGGIAVAIPSSVEETAVLAVPPRVQELAEKRQPPADDTFPKLVLQRAESHGARPAIREKDFGIWQTWSWADAAANMRTIACGFASLGMQRGDRIAIIGDNRPQFYWSMLAAQCLGAVPVPVYQDAVADEIRFVLDHAETRFAVAEDQEQVDKLLSVQESLQQLERIIYKDPRGLRHYRLEALMSLQSLQQQGAVFESAHPDFVAREVAIGSGSDLSVIAYTSGTTGRPKGVMLSFNNLILGAQQAMAFDHLNPDDEVLAYLPMAWVGDHFFSYAQAIVAGFTINCPESAETVMTDLKEIGPTYFFAPPRIFESILTQVMIRMEDAALLKRWLFSYFISMAKRCGVRILEGKPVSFRDRALYGLGRLLIFGPLRNAIGFSRIRVAYTAGEAMGPDIFTFFRSLGVNLKQFYGQTESSAYCCLQTDDDVRPDTVGPPAPGVQV